MRRITIAFLTFALFAFLAWWLFGSKQDEGRPSVSDTSTTPAQGGDIAIEDAGGASIEVEGNARRLSKAVTLGDEARVGKTADQRVIRGRLRAPVKLSEGTVAILESGPDYEAAMFEVMRSAWNDMENSMRSGALRELGREPTRLASAAISDDGSFEVSTSFRGAIELELQHGIARLTDDVRIEALPEPEPATQTEPGRPRGSDQRVVELGDIPCELASALVVVVEDANGHAVDGARVRLSTPFNPMAFVNFETGMFDFRQLERLMRKIEARTNASGIAKLNAIDRAGSVEVDVRADGHGPASTMVNLTPGYSRVARVKLTKAAKLEVTVLSDERQPVSGARIAVQAISNDALALRVDEIESRTARGRSADDGRVVLDSLPPGPCAIKIVAQGFVPFEAEVRLDAGLSVVREFVLDHGKSVRGRVIDEGEAPVVGAKVGAAPLLGQKVMGFDVASFVPEAAMVAASLERAVTTDEEGRFELRGLEGDESVRLVASKSGHSPAALVAEIGADDVVIELQQLGSVRGRVVREEDGQAVEDFKVRAVSRAMVFFESERGRQEQATGGGFTLTQLPLGDHTLQIEAADRAPQTVRVKITSATEQVDVGVVALAPPSSLRGNVVDVDDKAIEGATVRVSKGGMADMKMMAWMRGDRGVTTEADGAFELVGLPARKTRLHVEKEGYAPLRSEPVVVEKGKVTGPIKLVLDRGSIVEGRVVDDQQRPVSDWLVSLKSMARGVQLSRKTDENGNVRFEAIAAGDYRVEALPSSFFDKVGRESMQGSRFGKGPDIGKLISESMRAMVVSQVHVPPAGRATFELIASQVDGEAASARRVLGRVTMGGRPLEDGIVEFEAIGTEGRSFATIKAGAYRFDALAPGAYRTRVRASLFDAGSSDGATVRVEAEQREQRIDLELPAGRIRGRVVTSDGVAVPFAFLRLSRVDELREASVDASFDLGNGLTMTDAEGGFVFEGLMAGEYGLTARQIDVRDRPRAGRRTGIRLGEAQSLDEVEIVVEEAAELEVSVKNSDGSPARGARVRLLDVAGRPMRAFEAVLADDRGRAAIGGLSSGAYRVVINAEGHAAEVSDILVIGREDTSTTVRLRNGVSVVVRIEGKPDPALAKQSIAFALYDDRGRFVRAGRWTLPELGPGGDLAVEFDLGRLQPGTYRVRLEAFSLGSVELERQVKDGASSQWQFRVAGRDLR
mgnify:CR=1 FL=1